MVLYLAWFVDIIPRLPVTSGFCGAGKVVSGILFSRQFRDTHYLFDRDIKPGFLQK